MNKEQLEAYTLAGVGALQGAYRYYVRPELTARNAWAAIAGFVAVYEMVAPPGELLSEGVDSSLVRYPNLTRAAIGITALHLANLLPNAIDPFHQGLKLIKHG